MSKVCSKTIEIFSPTLPPKVDFIELEFKKLGYDVIRWAIVDIIGNKLIISISYLDS